MIEAGTTISFILTISALTQSKLVHQLRVISTRRAVDSVLMILFQARHFTVQQAPRKYLETGRNLLLTTHHSIFPAHTMVDFSVHGIHKLDLIDSIRSAAVEILIRVMASQHLMTQVHLALDHLSHHLKIKHQEEVPIVGAPFRVACG